MKKPGKKILYHLVNIVTIGLIVECFLCAMMLVRKNAEQNCFDRIEETADQVGTMFRHAMDDRQEKLTVFADILAASSGTSDERLQAYMQNFCRTQDFSAVCIHLEDGSSYSYGQHPHDAVQIQSFAEEIDKLPYVSGVFSYGNEPEDNFIYQAVPIMHRGQARAVLYGYMSLDVFPGFIASSSYDGLCRFYVVDGDTGNFLMDEYHGKLGNIYDGSMGGRETRAGYDMEDMREGVRAGKKGFFVFRSQKTNDWYYTYYMPLGINNWSMQLTIDESTAFETYWTISHTMFILMILVIVLIVILIISLMAENARVNRRDKDRLRRSDFINAVQHSLLNVYTNADAMVRALGTVAGEIQAETVLLLSFSDHTVMDAQYWPSSDKAQAMDLVGRNIREDFPMLYDRISTGRSLVYDGEDQQWDLSQTATALLRNMNVSGMILVPIMDTAGGLKGAIAAVNPPRGTGPELIESVVYDFFMALTNLESHNIIRRMGAYDYLTGLKNRNSFERETAGFVTVPGESLWCAYVDVNGLHELNNRKGHKAGDRMLCAVADAIRKIFGTEHTYRLGGDEFVAFRVNSSHEEFMSFKHRLLDELDRKGYSVSVGFEGAGKNRNGVFDVEQLLADAEAIMYHDKREYYQQSGLTDRDRT